MERKDKKVLVIISGVFLIVLAFILFLTMQAKDNMMENAGRYKGTEVQLADTIANCKTKGTTEAGGQWVHGSWVDTEMYPSGCSSEPPSGTGTAGNE